ncbi:MAG: hypothetical protein KDA92_10790, partial [Planctomycetales bacterium]|nr:hypothetical protein [Planctomycetales bacterium]
MWKLLQFCGVCAALVGLATVREVNAGGHPPLFPDFCELDADFNWFEPIYCDSPDASDANEGMYFSYERVNWNVLSAPRTAVGDPTIGNPALHGGLVINSSILVKDGLGNAPLPTPISNAIDVAQPDSEFGWGNRFEFGYIWDNAGWNIGVVEGYESVDSETYGVENTNVGAQPFTGSVAVLFEFPPGLLEGFVDADGDGAIDDVLPDNVLTFDDTTLFVPSFDTLTINHRSRIDGVEVMRTLRRNDFYARNSVVEFMYGVRFMRVDNEMRALGLGGFLADSNWASEVENKMVGPQVALRWSKSQRRWGLRAQGRFMAAMNIRDASLKGTMASLL